MLRRLVPVCLLSAALWNACARPQPPHVLLIVVDAWRADRVDFYDTGRQLTPFLTSLAARGTVFWRAYAQTSWTMPSVASLWTSRYPSQHGVTSFSSVLPDTERTLAEAFRAHGYATAAFSANPMLAKPGLERGFERQDRPGHGRKHQKESAAHLSRRGLIWLDGRPPGTPVFLYLHYMEPHFPYLPPREALERLLSRRQDPEPERRALADMLFEHRRDWKHPDAVMADLLHDLYDAEVLSLDAQLKRFFSALGKRGFLRNAIVVITADHGEELLDHGGIGHGGTLYNEVIRIPLLMLVPGQAARVDVSSVVSEVDIAPTLLDLAGIPAPTPFEGHSLRGVVRRARRPWPGLDWMPALLGWRDHGAYAYSELLSLPNGGTPRRQVRSVVVGSEKLMVDASAKQEIYDLDSDPHETAPEDLPASDRLALQQALELARQRATRNVSAAHTERLDPRTRERMRMLGYGT